MTKLPSFPEVLYSTETKFAKGCPYEWPYDLESAEMLLDHCCSNNSLQELVSDYIYCFKDKDSMRSTVWDSSDEGAEYDLDWDLREWDGCAKSTIRFYQHNQDSQTFLLHEDCLSELCPKIKEWEYSTIVCSALFATIQNFLETKNRVPEVYWKSWMEILLDARFGLEFQALIERNALFETCSKQVIRGFRSALMWASVFFFEKTKPDQFIRVLQVLKIPENQIQELMSWTFENQDLSKLLSFLDTYTFTEFTLELFNEFLESLPLTEKQQKQILEDMHTQLELPTIWGSTLDDFFVSTQIENYQQLKTQEQSILKKAFLLALDYKNKLQQDSNLVLSSIPPLCVLEKYLSNLSTKEYKQIQKALFVNKITMARKHLALYILLITKSTLLLGGGFMPPLANREIANTVIIRLEQSSRPRGDDQFYAEKQLQKSASFRDSKVKAFQARLVARPKNTKVIEANLKECRCKDFSSFEENSEISDLVCLYDTEDRVVLIGIRGGYVDIKDHFKKFKGFEKKVEVENNPYGILFSSTNLEADHIVPHLLGRAMKIRGEAGSRFDLATAVLTTPAVNKIRTQPGQFIRKIPYQQSSPSTYRDLIADSFQHFQKKLIDSEYSICDYFKGLKDTRADHMDRLLQGYEEGKNIVTNQLEQIYLERDELESNLVIPYIEHRLYGLALTEDIKSFQELSWVDHLLPQNSANDIIKNLRLYTDHTSGLLPYYRNTRVEEFIENEHKFLLQQYRTTMLETSRTYPRIPEFKSALLEIEDSQLKPNQSQTWAELDDTAQKLGLNNANGRQGRVFHKKGLKTLKKEALARRNPKDSSFVN